MFILRPAHCCAMRRLATLSLLALLVEFSVAYPVVARMDEDFGFVRVIATGDPTAERSSAERLGCKVVHELVDSLALECPKVVAAKYRPDRILHTQDLGAAHAIGANLVWNMGYTGVGTAVAILDTGIDMHHPELSDSIAGGKGFGFENYADLNGHGTHVAGIITANGNDEYAKGVAPDAKVWIAKVCNVIGDCYESDVAAAVEYIVENKIAPIINISLGGPGTGQQNCDADSIASVINYAVSQGIIVVAAAGNSPTDVSTPACASGAIAVGGVSKQGDLAEYSGRGMALDVVAPGTSIYSTDRFSLYSYRSGTSMATPHVAAAAALIMQANPNLTPANVSSIITSTAKDLGPIGWDLDYGWGMVDAAAAVALATSSIYDHAPPRISNVTGTPAGQQRVLISWSTDEPATSQVDFGKVRVDENTTPVNLTLTRTHSVYISIPSTTTICFYRTKSRDVAGNLALSQVYILILRGSSVSAIFISDLTLQLETRGSHGRAIATVRLGGGTLEMLQNAYVIGQWSGFFTSQPESSPAPNGFATFTSTWADLENSYVTFTVLGVSSEGAVYDPSKNVASAATIQIDLSAIVCTGFATRLATQPGC